MRATSRNPDEFLRWRNVETPCEECHGKGGRAYASTSTWRGGMGGCAITWDVCDHCWGSGDEHEHWTDLRDLRARMNNQVAAEAASLLANRVGVSLSSLHPAIEMLCKVLDKEANRRKPPTGDGWWEAYHWRVVCEGLARALREAMAARKAAG